MDRQVAVLSVFNPPLVGKRIAAKGELQAVPLEDETDRPIDGVNRNAMWLSWNEVVQITLVEGEMDQASYQEGRDTFSEQLAANNVSAMQSVVDHDCDQGENHLWRWW